MGKPAEPFDDLEVSVRRLHRPLGVLEIAQALHERHGPALRVKAFAVLEGEVQKQALERV